MTQQLRPSSARAASLRALVDVVDEPSPGVENVTVGAVFRLTHDHRTRSSARPDLDCGSPHCAALSCAFAPSGSCRRDCARRGANFRRRREGAPSYGSGPPVYLGFAASAACWGAAAGGGERKSLHGEMALSARLRVPLSCVPFVILRVHVVGKPNEACGGRGWALAVGV